MDGGKRGDGGNNGEGDNGVKCHGDCDEEQESRYFICEGVR